jgi:arabinan endo-1,5-alpha-L-arabinosidase
LCLAWLLLLALTLNGQAQMPVYGDVWAHDPSTMIKDGDRYYIFRTSPGIMGKYSTDLRNWTYSGQVFPNGIPPAWVTNAVPGFTAADSFWAPDIAYFNGRYNLYYAVSRWGTIDSAIGLVTSPSLTSPVWTDRGKVIQSDATWEATSNTDLTSYNCIDPSILVDTNGTVWMSFGSYSDGILVMQLDPATGKRIAPNSPVYRVANNGPVFFSNTEEASCLYQHGGYYYLFVNFGGCCAGIDSTYNIRVGRSPQVTGPFYDQNNVSLLDGGGTVLLESTGRFIGPGHAAIMNDNGTNWFTYHYYDGNDNGTAKLGLNRLAWSADGWPELTNDWSAFYPFTADARENLATYNGTLQNGAAITNDPDFGRALRLDGVSQYASLPVSVANCRTLATWVKWNGGVDWQRIFDFGNSTSSYCFLTPRTSTGVMRFAITTNGNGAEQQINAPFALPTNSWCHVAVALDGSQGVLYFDGTPVATNTGLTIRPWQTMSRNNNLGKSQWPDDPLFGGEISSFRIFGRALDAAEIRDLAWAPPALAHRYSFNGDARDSIGMANGTLMGNASIKNNALKLTGAAGDYVSLPGGLVSGSSAVTLEFWASFGANGDWARVVDFGNMAGDSGSQYFFFSPHTSLGGQRMELSGNTTTTFDPAGTFDHRTLHVACIVDPTNHYAAVYTNGVLEQSLTASWPAFSSVSTAWSFIGRSLFQSDAWLNGTIDELRLYDGRLTPQQIAVNDEFGPDALALPVSLERSNAVSQLTFSWPSWAVGFTLESSTKLHAGQWIPVPQPPQLADDRWSATVPKSTVSTFYRLRR